MDLDSDTRSGSSGEGGSDSSDDSSVDDLDPFGLRTDPGVSANFYEFDSVLLNLG
jgi:hypothetical protein